MVIGDVARIHGKHRCAVHLVTEYFTGYNDIEKFNNSRFVIRPGFAGDIYIEPVVVFEYPGYFQIGICTVNYPCLHTFDGQGVAASKLFHFNVQLRALGKCAGAGFFYKNGTHIFVKNATKFGIVDIHHFCGYFDGVNHRGDDGGQSIKVSEGAAGYEYFDGLIGVPGCITGFHAQVKFKGYFPVLCYV
jgi:hypothetical protein